MLAAVNKIDVAPTEDAASLEEWAREVLAADTYAISALTGEGIAQLGQALDAALPEGPFLYPADEIASQPVRFFVAELVRETVFEQFREEIPYSVFVQVEEFREHQDPVYIGATVHVERNSQKRILIGDKGRAVKELGQTARRKIEALLGHPVYLDLWVKHLPNWRRKRTHLKKLGFKVPEDHELAAHA